MPEGNPILALLGMLGAVLLVTGLAYGFTRFVLGRSFSSPGSRKSRMQVVDGISLGKDQKVVLLRAGERYYLLGAGSQNISLLRELSPEEAEPWKDREIPAASGFMEILQKADKLKKSDKNQQTEDGEEK